MRPRHGEGARPNSENVVASAAIAMVIAQSLRLSEWLDVVIQQGKKLFVPNILDAFGDFHDSLTEACIVHLVL